MAASLDQLLEDVVRHIDDEKRKKALWEALRQSTVYVAAEPQEDEQEDEQEEPEERRTDGETATIQMITTKNENGRQTFPFFTSLARVDTFAATVKRYDLACVELKSKDFFLAARSMGAVLNSGSENSLYFSPEELTELAGEQ